MWHRYDKLVRQIEESFDRGDLSEAEYFKQMRELDRDYRESAEEAAREAYDAELERW